MATFITSASNNIQIVEATGRLDTEGAPEMGKTLDHLLDEGDNQLILDLSGVDYMSSAGLREMVRIFKRARSDGGDLRLVNPSDRVITVMQIAGLDTAVKIFPTRAAAVSSF